MAETPPKGTLSGQISSDAVQLLDQYTGRGPTKARTVIGKDCVTILLADTLTTAERTLVEGGQHDDVLRIRHQFQMLMRGDLVEIVERATSREVQAFMSDNHIDPDYAAEVFVLAPARSELNDV